MIWHADERIAELEARVERMREALEFYSEAWDGHSGDSGPGGQWPADPESWPSEELLDDGGEHARNTLADRPDTSKAVDEIQASTLREFGLWCRQHQGTEVFPYGADTQKGIDLFAAQHGIQITEDE